MHYISNAIVEANLDHVKKIEDLYLVEETVSSVKSYINKLKQEYRGMASFAVKEINEKGYCLVELLENSFEKKLEPQNQEKKEEKKQKQEKQDWRGEGKTQGEEQQEKEMSSLLENPDVNLQIHK